MSKYISRTLLLQACVVSSMFVIVVQSQYGHNFFCYNRFCNFNCTPNVTCPIGKEICDGVCWAKCANDTFRCTGSEATECDRVCKSQQEVDKPEDEVSCLKTDSSGNVWSVAAGKAGIRSCPNNANGATIWTCGYERKFITEQPYYSNCSSTWVNELIRKAADVKDLSDALRFFDGLISDTSNPTGSLFFGYELPKILHQIVKVISTVQANNTIHKLRPFVSKVVQSNDNLLNSTKQWEQLSQEQRSRIFTELVGTMEKVAFIIGSKLLDSQAENGTSVKIRETQNYHHIACKLGALRIRDVSKSTFQFYAKEDNDHIGDESSIQIQVAIDKFESDNGTLKYFFWTLNPMTAQRLLPGLTKIGTGDRSGGMLKGGGASLQTMRQLLNGEVLALTIVRTDIKGKTQLPPELIGNVTVKLTFHHEYIAWGNVAQDIRRSSKIHGSTAVLRSAKCMFWDADNLKWSQEGCILLRTNSTVTVCLCNHLTSFAVLMDSHNYMGEDLILEAFTIILCSMSIISLLLTVIAYSITKSRSRDRSVITKNLSFFLMLGNILLLLVLDRDYFMLNKTACAIVGALAHFVFTLAFTWMAVEGFHLYSLIFNIGKDPKMTITRYKILCCGSAAAVVFVTFGIGFITGDKVYGNEAICWLNDQYTWGFNGPVAVIVLINIVILILALKVSYRKGNSNIRSTKSVNRKWIQGGLCLTTLLGITWSFGYFMVLPGVFGYIAAYVFTTLCASQGVFIFTFYCVMDENIRKDLSKLWSRYNQGIRSGFTAHSRS